MSNSDGQFGAWLRTAVERFEGRLVRYAARITGDVETGREVVQETFLRLCRQDPAGLDGHLAQWLFTVCRRRAIDVRRQENRMQTITPDQASRRPASEADGAALAEVHDTTDQVARLLSTLPDSQQEAVRLKFQEGLSYREISDITGHSISNVGVLLHTALKRLREELNR